MPYHRITFDKVLLHLQATKDFRRVVFTSTCFSQESRTKSQGLASAGKPQFGRKYPDLRKVAPLPVASQYWIVYVLQQDSTFNFLFKSSVNMGMP